MGTMWIVAANSSYAKIFEVKGHGRQIIEVKHLDFPEGRLKSSEVGSDRPGRAFDKFGAGRHAHSPEVSYHEHEQQVFSHKIASILHEAHEQKTFDELALVAPAHFLGYLKQAISNSVKKCIFKEVHKDLPEGLDGRERIDHLCKYLDLWNRCA